MALTKVTSGGLSDIAAAVEGASDSNKFTDADHTKLNAIESEHLKNVQSDLWRYSYFTDLISKKKSMINKFSTGNLLTLKKPNVREKMIEFYNKYYISSNS